jgi:abortive infection bacteriophage resistance protein
MGQIATTIEEQIQLLKNRGMVFDCQEEKVKEQLLDIGYYRLGFYWFPFEVDKSHNFKEGTRFSDCVQLYYFDVEFRKLVDKNLKNNYLKSIVLKKINTILYKLFSIEILFIPLPHSAQLTNCVNAAL